MSENKRFLWLLAVLTIISLGMWAMTGTMPGTLYFDQSGTAHGTGTARCFYSSGRLKLEDRYVAGELVEETWYKPDGSVLANEKLTNGCGVWYLLRDDGSIEAKMPYIDGNFEGTATYFSTNGEVERTVEYVGGQEVGG